MKRTTKQISSTAPLQKSVYLSKNSFFINYNILPKKFIQFYLSCWKKKQYKNGQLLLNHLKRLAVLSNPRTFFEIISHKFIYYVNIPSIMGITVKWKQNFEQVWFGQYEV